VFEEGNAFQRCDWNESVYNTCIRGKPMTKEIKKESDLLVSIAEKEIPFFFVNHLNQSCVVAKVRNHYEMIEMNDDSFLILMRQMWRNNNASRITVSENTLKRARAALVASTMQLEQPRIKTHLRVAWKVKKSLTVRPHQFTMATSRDIIKQC
jgi:hypothetical protein